MDLLTALPAGKVCKAFSRVDAPEPDPLISSPLPNQLRIPAFEPIQEDCARRSQHKADTARSCKKLQQKNMIEQATF